eukprot:TRINITY_DN26754_c0_g1_i2.p1 TRINITY_DN26754_c0_g1~~TRINITY_DN26754_c0_g1_i2.p1  ORF type:complete len:224 (+),score=18.62 TRINITY_DN26754_c0_g1_i2:538-1209(+)
MTLVIEFAPPTREKVSFLVQLTLGNFVESRSDYNLIRWLPYGPLWEGSTGALVANATFNFVLPFGNGVADSVTPLQGQASPSRGYTVVTNLKEPAPVEVWTEKQLDMSMVFDLWMSEWGSEGQGVAGQQPLRINIAFEIQMDSCGHIPLWVYFAISGACALLLYVSCSGCGYCYFEQPWRSLKWCSDNPWSRRRGGTSRQDPRPAGSSEFTDLQVAHSRGSRV